MEISQNELDESTLSPEETQKLEEVQEILKAESIEPTVALNILIHAINVSYDKEHFNDLDRMLIVKALDCFKSYIDKGENFEIMVK
jgi:hypothetical protein